VEAERHEPINLSFSVPTHPSVLAPRTLPTRAREEGVVVGGMEHFGGNLDEPSLVAVIEGELVDLDFGLLGLDELNQLDSRPDTYGFSVGIAVVLISPMKPSPR
jgi:hypothetical protein